jgi:hypothetical protein
MIKMQSKQTALAAVLAALAVLFAAFAASASATPQWKFEKEALSGTETVLGGAYESAMTVPGLTTTCENFLYKLAIVNKSGAGTGELNEMPLYECDVNPEEEEVACEVGSIGAENLPWNSHLSTASGKNYVVIEEVEVGIVYTGEECVLNEILVTVTGSAGGVVNNETETAQFNAETLAASGTSLEAFGNEIEWNGLFPTEAFEWHRNQAISVS